MPGVQAANAALERTRASARDVRFSQTSGQSKTQPLHAHAQDCRAARRQQTVLRRRRFVPAMRVSAPPSQLAAGMRGVLERPYARSFARRPRHAHQGHEHRTRVATDDECHHHPPDRDHGLLTVVLQPWWNSRGSGCPAPSVLTAMWCPEQRRELVVRRLTRKLCRCGAVRRSAAAMSGGAHAQAGQ